MWKRIELHNHTDESDGELSPLELASFFSEKHISAFSLTDHNTVSGCIKLTDAKSIIGCGKLPAAEFISGYGKLPAAEFISGCELTTWYGHLLCQNISSPICWEDLDQSCADPLFERIHQAGGLAGPAHPFSIPSPFSNGMRWTMKLHNLHLIDFVEVINNSHPMAPDNGEAILWWEELILSGVLAAAVSGLDLHGPMELNGFYKTYIFVREKDIFKPLSFQLEWAIRSCLTCVTKTEVLSWQRSEDGIHVFFQRDKRNCRVETDTCICRIRTRERTFELPMPGGSCFLSFRELPAKTEAVLFSAFEKIVNLSHLIAIAPPLLSVEEK